MIENEQWTHVEVPVDFQNMINSLIQNLEEEDGEDEDHRINLLKRQNSDKSLNDGSNMTIDSFRKQNKGEIMKSKDFLMIKGHYYFVVGFMLLFIKASHDYINVAKNVPSISTDVLHRLLELLKLVNSKTCQMILGAGAIKSAGLKNITAKHIGRNNLNLT